MENGAAGSDDGATSNPDAGTDERVVRQPHFVFDVDRSLLNGKSNLSVIMAACTEVDVVRDSNAGTDDDFTQIIKYAIIGDPDVIPNR